MRPRSHHALFCCVCIFLFSTELTAQVRTAMTNTEVDSNAQAERRLRIHLWKETMVAQMRSDPQLATRLWDAAYYGDPAPFPALMNWIAESAASGLRSLDDTLGLPGEFGRNADGRRLLLSATVSAAARIPTPNEVRTEATRRTILIQGDHVLERLTDTMAGRLERAQSGHGTSTDREFAKSFSMEQKARGTFVAPTAPLDELLRRAPANAAIAALLTDYNAKSDEEKRALTADFAAFRRQLIEAYGKQGQVLKELEASTNKRLDDLNKKTDFVIAQVAAAQDKAAERQRQQDELARSAHEYAETRAALQTLGLIANLVDPKGDAGRMVGQGGPALVDAAFALASLSSGFSFAASAQFAGSIVTITSLFSNRPDADQQRFEAIMASLQRIEEQLRQVRLQMEGLDLRMDRLSSGMALLSRNVEEGTQELRRLNRTFEDQRLYSVLSQIETAQGSMESEADNCLRLFRGHNEQLYQDQFVSCTGDFYTVADRTAGQTRFTRTDLTPVGLGQAVEIGKLLDSGRSWADFMAPLRSVLPNAQRTTPAKNPDLWTVGVANFVELHLIAPQVARSLEDRTLDAQRLQTLGAAGQAIILQIAPIESDKSFSDAWTGLRDSYLGLSKATYRMLIEALDATAPQWLALMIATEPAGLNPADRRRRVGSSTLRVLTEQDTFKPRSDPNSQPGHPKSDALAGDALALHRVLLLKALGLAKEEALPPVFAGPQKVRTCIDGEMSESGSRCTDYGWKIGRAHV